MVLCNFLRPITNLPFSLFRPYYEKVNSINSPIHWMVVFLRYMSCWFLHHSSNQLRAHLSLFCMWALGSVSHHVRATLQWFRMGLQSSIILFKCILLHQLAQWMPDTFSTWCCSLYFRGMNWPSTPTIMEFNIEQGRVPSQNIHSLLMR